MQVGTPPVNLLNCPIDGSALRFADGTIIVWSHTPACGKVTFGIRPEHVTIHPVDEPGTLPASLYVTQMLGGKSLEVTYVGEQLVSVRLFTDELPELPARVGLAVDPAYLLFYGADGKLLT